SWTRTQFVKAVQPEFRHRIKNILRRTVGRAEIDQLVDVVLDSRGAEYCVGDQAGTDISDGQAIRLGIAGNIVGRLSSTTPRDKSANDNRFGGNILTQKRDQRWRAQGSRSSRFAALDEHDSFALEIGRGLREDRRI